MAKKGHGKNRRFTMRKVRINSSFLVGNLSSLDVGAGTITAAVADRLRVISANLSYSWSDIGAAVDDALTFGLAHSDYSAAEIEECLESNSSIDLGDKIAQEQANRLVRIVGTITNESGAAGGGAKFNGGAPVKTKLNWKLAAGDQLGIWVRNASGTVYTTGSAIVAAGDLWVQD